VALTCGAHNVIHLHPHGTNMCSGARRPPPPTPSLPILVFRRPQPAALAPRATASSLFFRPSSSSAARVLLPPRPRPAPPTRHLIALGRCHPRLASLPPASAAYASPSRLRPAPPIPPFASPRLASFSLAVRRRRGLMQSAAGRGLVHSVRAGGGGLSAGAGAAAVG